MKSVFDNAGYIGHKPFDYGALLSVSVGTGASVQGAASISWTHTVTSFDTYIIAAISAYPYYDDSNGTLWVGSATVGNTAMTLVKSGYRLGVWSAPVTGSGAKTITYTASPGNVLYAAGNSISFKNCPSLGSTIGYAQDYGTHALTATGKPNSIMAFFTGQAYDSASPGAPSGFAERFWTRQTGTYSSVGCYTTTVPSNGSASFSIYTGQYGSTVAVPVNGAVA